MPAELTKATRTALEGLLPAPAREALLAEGELRWAQVALAAAAVEGRAGGPSS